MNFKGIIRNISTSCSPIISINTPDIECITCRQLLIDVIRHVVKNRYLDNYEFIIGYSKKELSMDTINYFTKYNYTIPNINIFFDTSDENMVYMNVSVSKIF